MMDWTTVISSILAGGLAGQLTVAWLNRRKDLQLAELNATINKNREFNNWLRQERYKASIELIDLVSSHYSKTACDEWPEEIRSASIRIHLLNKNGTAPEDLSDTMQNLFQMALNRKLGRVKTEELQKWNHSFRDKTRKLRELLAKQLYDDNA